MNSEVGKRHYAWGNVKVVGVEGHGYINGGEGRGVALLAVVKGGGLPEERELRGRTAGNNNLRC